MTLRAGSLFSGIGAPELAMPWAIWQWCAEIDPFPAAVHEARFGTRNLGDVTKADWSSVSRECPIDVLVFGSPCQSFSVAGKRLGLDDPRGNLALYALGVARQLRPEWLVFENVPGLLSSDSGRDFGAFLGLLAECGYGWAYRVLDAQYFGVAQRRRRVFLVGHLGDWRRAAAVLFEPESLRWNPPPRREAGQGVAASLTVGAGGSSGHQYRQKGGEQNVVAMSLNAKGGSGRIVGESETFVANVAPPITSNPYGDHESREGLLAVTHSLRADGFDASEDRTGRGTPLVAAPITAGYSKGVGVNDGKKGSPQNLILGSSVRRLTPRECERLQGFPDDWTAITYRGKPAADGNRYKAIGNSMAVPVVKWVGDRLRLASVSP